MNPNAKLWLAAGGAASLGLVALSSLHHSKPATVAAASTPASRQALVSLPMAFEPNAGQTDARVRYLARGPGYSLFLGQTEAVFSLRAPTAGSATTTAEPAVLRMSLHGASAAATIEGEDLQPGRSHYLRGRDPAHWQHDVAHYGKVRYHDVYRGVDVVYYGNQQQLEYDFVVAPGADPQQIAIDFSGVRGLRLDTAGDLVLQTAAGDVIQHKPVLYQTIEGQRRPVEGSYRLLADNRVGFTVGRYDAEAPLVLDPTISYMSYLGGSGDDHVTSMATDETGNLYVVGCTASTDFPTAGSFQSAAHGGGDVFVAKLNPDNDVLVYSSYLGGSAEDCALGLAVDTTGSAYVTGWTASTDFPVASALQPAHAVDSGQVDAFVTKLTPSGGALAYGTYLGGYSDDYGYAIAVDGSGAAYVGGYTSSPNFPLKAALRGQAQTDGADGFVAKLSPAGTALVYSTFIGGSNFDWVFGLDVDAAGNAYIAGETGSGDFPVMAATRAQPYPGGAHDGFVAKLNSAGNGYLFSSYLGGRGSDLAFDLVIDRPSGDFFVVGRTTPPTGTANNFPTFNAAQPTPAGGKDGFVTGYNAIGELEFSTYFGGSGDDEIREVVAAHDSPYFTGFTTSTDLPIAYATAMQPTPGGGTDAFVARLTPGSGSRVIWSSYLGGSGEDSGYAIALYGTGNIFVAGTTSSTDLHTLAPFRAAARGGGDAFVARLGVRGISTYTHDFDGDVVGDVLWRNPASGANVVWRSGNSATSQAVASLPGNWQVGAVADFDCDGKADILWRDPTAGAIRIWSAANSALAKTQVTVNPDWQPVGTGEFDETCGTDLLWRNRRTGANSIWLSANPATLQGVTGVTNLAWQIAGTGDFDNDGFHDILWRNASTGANVIWRSANSTTQSAVTAITNTAWKVAGVGDFYGDGKSDILWRNTSTGANAIWRSANAATAQPILGVTNRAWKIAAVADYNGDARSDILWHNSSTGANTIWRSGNALRATSVTGVTNLAWSIVP
jgi:hypothetical protein